MMTVTHALLLYAAHMAGHCRAYTYCPAAEDFVDRLTIATRRRFGQPGFNPRRVDSVIATPQLGPGLTRRAQSRPKLDDQRCRWL